MIKRILLHTTSPLLLVRNSCNVLKFRSTDRLVSLLFPQSLRRLHVPQHSIRGRYGTCSCIIQKRYHHGSGKENIHHQSFVLSIQSLNLIRIQPFSSTTTSSSFSESTVKTGAIDRDSTTIPNVASKEAIATTATITFDPKHASGEELYQQYLLTTKQLEQIKAEQEQLKSEKMFEAWKRTNDQALSNNTNDADANTSGNRKKNNMGGVAVVRTLAREVAKNRDNDPIQKLEKRSYQLLQIAAIKHKHPKALIALGNIEMKQFADEYSNTSSDGSESVTMLGLLEKLSPILKYYDIAAQAGEAEAYYNLAHIYWDGIPGIIEASHETALQYMEQAIHLGDIDAMYFVGEHRLQNKHLYRLDQLQKALIWIETAADQGHGDALYSLTLLHMKGCDELQIPICSNEEFQRRIQLAIEHDDSGDAYFLRATTYHDGTFGNPIDIRLWYEDMVKSAELGHATACLYVGVLLFKGHPTANIEQDQARAFQYYQRAGELGNIEGWRCVVDCYLTGQGVQQNIEMAKYIGETMVRPYDDAAVAASNINEENSISLEKA